MILRLDEESIVLSVQAPEERPRLLYFFGLAVLVAIPVAAVGAVFRAYVNTLGLAAAWAGAFVATAAMIMTRTVLVAVVETDQIFFERTNRITRRRRRQVLGRLSDVRDYEVYPFVDTDSEFFPYPVFELTVVIGKRIPIWNTGSRDEAVRVGGELIRLASRARGEAR